MSSVEIYKKNNAMLKAGKIKPIIGTKIEGKNDAAIFLFSFLTFKQHLSLIRIGTINCI